jgi:SAM-dependent methyltransferase
MELNGRQVEPVRADHVNRYKFAALRVSKFDTVLDVACGAGYGSAILSRIANRVLGFDIDPGAIDYAQAHYSKDNIRFECQDLTAAELPTAHLAVSFETIEHLETPLAFLTMLRRRSKTLLASVPNQDVLPFDPVRHKHHHRHYTGEQFYELLRVAGWNVTHFYGQHGKEGGVEYIGRPGAPLWRDVRTRYDTIVVCAS